MHKNDIYFAGIASIVTPATHGRLVTALTPSNCCVSSSHLMPDSVSPVRYLISVSSLSQVRVRRVSDLYCCIICMSSHPRPSQLSSASLKHPRPGAGHCSGCHSLHRPDIGRLRLRGGDTEHRARAEAHTSTGGYSDSTALFGIFSNGWAILFRIHKTTSI